jgi:alkylhydroperoxidase family enzyme
MQHLIASSKRVGLQLSDWQLLQAGDYTRFVPQEQAALRFAEKLTRESRNIAGADIAALRAHFTEEQIVDLDVLVGLINLTNRLTDPLGAELEFAEESIPALSSAA